MIDSYTVKNSDLTTLLTMVLYGRAQAKLQLNLSSYETIVIYGAGSLGQMAVDLFANIGIQPHYIVDRDNTKHGCTINGITIISPDILCNADLSATLFIICIVTSPYDNIVEYLCSLGAKNIVHFYDVTESLGQRIQLESGWRYYDLSEIDKKNIKAVFDKWVDDQSKAYYLMMLYWRIQHKEVLFMDAPITQQDRLFAEGVIPPLSDSEIFIDCGAYNGNTIQRLLQMTNFKIGQIIAFEPDKQNFSLLQNYVTNLEQDLQFKIKLYPYGVGHINSNIYMSNSGGMAARLCKQPTKVSARMISLDHFVKVKPTFIKMHLESFEYQGLLGAIRLLQQSRPIIVITLYHSEDGAWRIPLYLMEHLENYCFYHRLHAYCAMSSVLYAVPEERAVKV